MQQPDLSSALAGAKSLLGWKLVHVSSEGLTAGIIVETEAYGMEDPASHAFSGPGARNAAMFERAGTVYVYFTYGMHYCVNIVTGEKGQGQGVLIRALEPIEGLELMKRRRKRIGPTELTNGPAKLTQAMGITKLQNGINIEDGILGLESGYSPQQIVQTTRIGISKAIDQPWRFYIGDNAFVSRKISSKM